MPTPDYPDVFAFGAATALTGPKLGRMPNSGVPFAKWSAEEIAA